MTINKKILIAVAVVLVVFAIVICLIFFAVGNAINGNLDVDSDSTTTISQAEIVDTGFAEAIPSTKDELKPIKKASVGDKIAAYCSVSDVDIPTNVFVYWTAPDGTKTQRESLSVNFNDNYYAEQTLTQSGTYKVTWFVYGKDIVEAAIDVA